MKQKHTSKIQNKKNSEIENKDIQNIQTSAETEKMKWK